MLASINPLGERARDSRWGVTVVAYLVGAVTAGALLGGVLGLVGAAARRLVSVAPWATLSLTALVCAVGLAVELGMAGLRVPTVRRQVNKDWLDEYRGWVYGVGFGFQLGLGVVTIVTTAAVYVTFLLAVVSGALGAGAAIGAAFGLARGLAVFAGAGVRDPARLWSVHRRFRAWDPPARRLTQLVELLLVAVAAGAAIAA